jgi:hypothetical protein
MELREFSFELTKVGRDLEVQLNLTADDLFPSVDSLSVTLVGHDDVSSDWLANLPLAHSPENLWTGKVADAVDDSWPHLIEVATLAPTPKGLDRNPTPKPMKAGVDYKHSLHLIGDEVFRGADCEATPELELERLKSIRNERVNRTLKSGQGSKEHRVAFLADGVLLTRSLYIPGVAMHPVQSATRGSDVPDIFNSLLTQAGWPSRLDPSAWTTEYSRRRPVVLSVASSVIAENGESALRYVREKVQSFLYLMSFLRGAEPQLISALVEVRDSSGNWITDIGWIDGAPYGGNLLGGFMGGEGQHAILASWDAIETDEKIKLWLSLFSDSTREQRWDFKWFRLFNLLEAISFEKYGETSPVIDFTGTPIKRPDGKITKTNGARGKVHRLVRDASVIASVAESSFCANTGQSLWDVAQIWTYVRNAVAHEGGYRENDALQNANPRNKKVNAAFAVQSKISYLNGLEEAARHVLRMLIAKQI